MRISIERLIVSLVIGACLGLVAWPGLSAVVGGAALPVATLLAGVAAWFSIRLLGQSIDGLMRRRPVLAVAWTVLAVVTVVQTARLSAHMADPSREWWHTTKQEFWSKHMCMAAYFYAADLNRQGEANVYDPDHYPVLNPEAENHATLANLTPDDPYQYPPQFLLLPRLAMALSNDFMAIRAVWFTVQALLFLLTLFLFARWYSGSSGMTAMWLIPLVWISVPSILNFQYGQFHVTTIVLAVGALLSFEKKKDVIGGGLLATAVLAKGFPGILLIPLLMNRQWRAVGWTGAWMVAFTGVAWAVLGPSPFEAFFTYHLPRMQSGVAFAFDEVWPDFKGWLLAGNVSPFALVRKLGELGLSGITTDAARLVQSLFSASLIVLAVVSSRVRSRKQRALVWLALANLAAMTSPAAWGDYVPVGTLWMLTFMMTGVTQTRLLAVSALAGFCVLLPGVVPIGNFPTPTVAMAMSVVGTIALLVTNVAVVAQGVRKPAPASVRPELVPAR
jgi:hypothetical protein